ncbi:MAG: succinate dehydrogenase cytochrome b subunit [Prevotellaceae bacterium]|jgi:succinate dehydrogenase / fumarate reductase cytochrome b subunit|nr:succinate dehydrogenase cytochrome b subunit [Prevotellaceae bacterium]
MSNIFCSSIGKKLIMSLSGLFLVVFLLLHVSVNLTALFSQDAYNDACKFMDTNIFIQVMVPVLALGFAIHILYSLIITLKNQKARPVKYSVSNKTEASSWASKNMFILGLIVFCFLALHLTHFWAKMQLQHFIGKHSEPDPYSLLVKLFSQWYYCVIYVVWIVALYFHISHGFWSAFQTLGVNNSKWIPRLQLIAKIYAIIVALAFISIPIYFYLGLNQ